MPAFSETKHAAKSAATVAQAQGAARALRAKAEQRIIDCECRATKLALNQDREAWRIYRRQQGKPAETFIPYET